MIQRPLRAMVFALFASYMIIFFIVIWYIPKKYSIFYNTMYCNYKNTMFLCEKTNLSRHTHLTLVLSEIYNYILRHNQDSECNLIWGAQVSVLQGIASMKTCYVVAHIDETCFYLYYTHQNKNQVLLRCIYILPWFSMMPYRVPVCTQSTLWIDITVWPWRSFLNWVYLLNKKLYCPYYLEMRYWTLSLNK